MKILIFSVAYHPFGGGAEIAVKEITDRISDAEFHLLTINLDGKQKPEEKIGNVYVHRLDFGSIGRRFKIGKYLFTFASAWRALSLNKEFNFDITWAIMASYSGFAALFLPPVT